MPLLSGKSCFLQLRAIALQLDFLRLQDGYLPCEASGFEAELAFGLLGGHTSLLSFAPRGLELGFDLPQLLRGTEV